MDKWLMNLNVVRVISLILGILLWWVVHNDQQPPTPAPPTPTEHTQTLDLSVDVIGLDENQLHIKSIQPSSVSVIMKGNKEDLDKLSPVTAKVILNLSSATAGIHTYPLRAVGFPENVKVDLQQPAATVNIEEMVIKEMPVTIDLLGNPADGFQAGTPIITPNRVHVSLPSSQMSQLESVRAQVKITDAKSAVKKQIKLVAYDKSGREMKANITPSIVNVEVPITSPFKTMPLQINLLGHLPEGYSVAAYSQSANQVTVYGPKDVLDKMDFYSGLQIDMSKITTTKEFSIDIPLQKRIIQVEPHKVDVTIKVVPSAKRTFKQVKIALTGQNNDYVTQVVKPDKGVMDITLEGAPDILNKLKPDDVQAIVDVSNLAQGTHQVPLIVNVPQFVKKAAPENVNVTVKITPKNAPAGNGSASGGSGSTGGSETPTGTGSTSGNTGTPPGTGDNSGGTGTTSGAGSTSGTAGATSGSGTSSDTSTGSGGTTGGTGTSADTGSPTGGTVTTSGAATDTSSGTGGATGGSGTSNTGSTSGGASTVSGQGTTAPGTSTSTGTGGSSVGTDSSSGTGSGTGTSGSSSGSGTSKGTSSSAT